MGRKAPLIRLPKADELVENISCADEAAKEYWKKPVDNIRLRIGVDDITPICVIAAIVRAKCWFLCRGLKSFPLRGNPWTST